MDIKNYKTVIVLFPPMLGGNHLANMISTSPNVSNRTLTDDDNYKKILNDYYSSVAQDAHVGNIKNVGVFDTNTVYETIKKVDKPFIIAGHIDEACYVFQTIQNLSPFLFIYFEWQTLNNAINKRINFIDPLLTKWAYSGNVISKIFETTGDNMYWIDPNDLFNEDITTFLRSINDNLNLDLDLDFCLELHKKWLRKIST